MRVLAQIFFAIFMASLATSAAAPVAAAQTRPGKGSSWQLLSGQDYLELAEYDREVYVTGVNDAYNWSYVAGFERMKWLVPCIYGRRAQQLAAMFAKWLEASPERWHEPVAKLFPFAMFDSCRKAKSRPKSKAKSKAKSERTAKGEKTKK